MTADPSVQLKRQSQAGLIGKIIAQRYLVKKHLGRGAMGSVFLAEHVVLKSPYALKILHPELSSHEETVQRFIREAQTTASIQHPNVCSSSDFGKLPDGSFYLVMEYLEGVTLRDLNKQMPQLPAERAIHITTQMLNALGKAHDLGIVHRDLKPENIMLIHLHGDPDFVKIMDFGLASLAPQNQDEEAVRLTMTGIVYGTPVYMSPEQVRADRHIDARADLYAIGAMLFEMLTGTIPFQGPNVTALLAQHLTEPVCSIHERAPGLTAPRSFDAVIQKAMAKKPEDRFQNAQEFVFALNAIAQEIKGLQSHMFDSGPDTLVDTDERSPLFASQDGAPTQPSMPAFDPQTQPPQQNPTTTPDAAPISPQRKTNSKKPLIAAAIVFAFVIIVGALALLTSSEPEPPALPDDPELRAVEVVQRASSSLASERDALLSQEPVLKAAFEKIKEEPEQAYTMLSTVNEDYAQNAHYHYITGLAAMGAEKESTALDAYEQAIALDEDYFFDTTFQRDLVLMLSDSSEDLNKHAQKLISTRHLEMIYPSIGVQAQTAYGRKKRLKLKGYLESTGFFVKLPEWRQAAISLRTASGCVEHGDAIKALAKSGSAKALEPLYQLSNKPKSGCGKKKRKDCYGCVRDELAAAISVLEAKFPEHTKDTSTSHGDEPDEDIEGSE